jgi:dimethylargininase
MFTKAIVRTPGRSLTSGLTAANLGTPDYQKALEQHRQYVAALERCGLDVLILEADEAFPDSTFVEDVAIVTARCAIITRPAAASRRGETAAILPVLENFYSYIEKIQPPGTLDGGDVMQVDQHFYIGLSSRTNRAGADQLIAILKRYAMTGSVVPVKEFLHLKTGVTQVAEKTLLAGGDFIANPVFSNFRIIPLSEEANGGANCILINNKLLVPAGFPEALSQLRNQGTEIVEVDISEYAKLDGGLTCLSLRF